MKPTKGEPSQELHEALKAVSLTEWHPFTCPKCGRQGKSTSPSRFTCLCGFDSKPDAEVAKEDQ